nr:hypothetical protein [Providencia stuartii]
MTYKSGATIDILALIIIFFGFVGDIAWATNAGRFIISPNVYADSLIEDPVKIFVMINYNWGIGHTGLVVGEGEEALLYDPSGEYSKCGSDNCFGSIEAYRLPRSPGEFF